MKTVLSVRRFGRSVLKLITRSERMFRTNLSNAAKEPPDFAGHYRIAYWGCGSNCSAGTMVDLKTGDIFPLPLAKPGGTGWNKCIMCTARFEGADDEFHPDSRLMIVRWEGNRFRQLLHVQGTLR